MQKPVIHLNGSGRAILTAQYQLMLDSVVEAVRVLGKNPPHARDYYVLGDSNAAKAHDEHFDRIQALSKVRDELMEILEHVQEP